jgi:dTDP-4-dehydrorhamnose reductase
MQSLIILGGSGYLGQFLIQALSLNYRILYTYSSKELPDANENVHAFQVDLKTGTGLEEVFSHAGSSLLAIINCAAISSPASCEGENQAMARALNVPHQLLKHLEQLSTSRKSLLIHLSTDQVYDGSKAMWKEDGPLAPVNAYGKSKVEAETEIRARWQNHVILRSSIIYGPKPPFMPVSSERFLQFIERSLQGSTPVTFFHDEWRSVVYVQDIVKVVSILVEKEGLEGGVTFNMGGPERISRLEFAIAVADSRGISKDLIVSASCKEVLRPIKSPQDISMNVSKIEEMLKLKMTPLREALASLQLQTCSN